MRQRRPIGAPEDSPASAAALPERSLVTSKGERSVAWAFLGALVPLLFVRSLSALFNTIPDCDETYNNWEPAHYMIFGSGLQTWEYSPAFALGSYAYLVPYTLLGRTLSFVFGTKVEVFYGIRFGLAILSGAAEASFCAAVSWRFGKETSGVLLAMLVGSSGMFHASTSLLPSTFCMYMTMFVYAAWMLERYRCAVFLGVVSVLLSTWPFIGFLYIPLAWDTLRHCGLLNAIAWGLQSGVCVLLPVAAFDSRMYGRQVFPCWNRFVYNVLGGSRGSQSELYGTEPWYFYLVNGFLNLNLSLMVGLAGGALLLAFRGAGAPGRAKKSEVVCYLLPVYMWFGLMSSQAHKEERFLFPIYPLLCFAAALGLTSFHAAADRVHFGLIGKCLVRLVVLGSCLLSASRSYSVVRNYAAPLSLASALHGHLALRGEAAGNLGKPLEVCVGKEWYRFPGSFFLPGGARVAFVKSAFDGQLPAHYQESNGSIGDGGHFNDQNKEELDRYTELLACDYMVDLELLDQKEAFLSQSRDWTVLAELPFLDASRSKSLFRAFYVPRLSLKHTAFARYVVLKRAGGQ